MKSCFLLMALFVTGVMWLIGGGLVWGAYSTHQQAVDLGKGSTPVASLKAGDEFRFDTLLQDTNLEVSPHQKIPCVAYQLRVFGVTSTIVRDEEGEEEERLQRDQVLEQRKGPPQLSFASPDAKVLLPLERWKPQDGPRFQLDSPDSVDYGKELPGSGARFDYFESEEVSLQHQAPYALVGRVDKIRDTEVLASFRQPVQVLPGTLGATSQQQAGEAQDLLLMGGVFIFLGFVFGGGLYALLSKLLGSHSPT